jgi:hypothetical protein
MSQFSEEIDLAIHSARRKEAGSDAALLSVSELTEAFRAIAERHISPIAKSLRALIGSESHLTIPLSDGIVAKVSFTGEMTKPKMDAFSKMFAAFAEHYVVTDSTSEQRAATQGWRKTDEAAESEPV